MVAWRLKCWSSRNNYLLVFVVKWPLHYLYLAPVVSPALHLGCNKGLPNAKTPVGLNKTKSEFPVDNSLLNTLTDNLLLLVNKDEQYGRYNL